MAGGKLGGRQRVRLLEGKRGQRRQEPDHAGPTGLCKGFRSSERPSRMLTRPSVKLFLFIDCVYKGSAHSLSTPPSLGVCKRKLRC